MKYFYDEDNLEAFREEYAAMPLTRRRWRTSYSLEGRGRDAAARRRPASSAASFRPVAFSRRLSDQLFERVL